MIREEDLTFMRAQMNQAAPAAEEPIQFYRYARTVPGDKAAGKPDKAEYDPPDGTEISATAIDVSLEAAPAPGGRRVDGAVVFQIRHDALPAASDDDATGTTGTDDQRKTAPSYQDRFVWKSHWYKPVRITAPRLGGSLFWVVRCERQ